MNTFSAGNRKATNKNNTAYSSRSDLSAITPMNTTRVKTTQSGARKKKEET
jgi:hypothetical protein